MIPANYLRTNRAQIRPDVVRRWFFRRPRESWPKRIKEIILSDAIPKAERDQLFGLGFIFVVLISVQVSSALFSRYFPPFLGFEFSKIIKVLVSDFQTRDSAFLLVSLSFTICYLIRDNCALFCILCNAWIFVYTTMRSDRKGCQCALLSKNITKMLILWLMLGVSSANLSARLERAI